MSDKYFLDTNVAVYAYSDIDLYKQQIAQTLLDSELAFISTQVLQEIANTFLRKFKKNWQDVEKIINELIEGNIINRNNEITVLKAIQIANTCKYSFYDSLIIAAALECQCSVLYSEDMHDGHLIGTDLRILNPFKK